MVLVEISVEMEIGLLHSIPCLVVYSCFCCSSPLVLEAKCEDFACLETSLCSARIICTACIALHYFPGGNSFSSTPLLGSPGFHYSCHSKHHEAYWTCATFPCYWVECFILPFRHLLILFFSIHTIEVQWVELWRPLIYTVRLSRRHFSNRM